MCSHYRTGRIVLTNTWYNRILARNSVSGPPMVQTVLGGVACCRPGGWDDPVWWAGLLRGRQVRHQDWEHRQDCSSWYQTQLPRYGTVPFLDFIPLPVAILASIPHLIVSLIACRTWCSCTHTPRCSVVDPDSYGSALIRSAGSGSGSRGAKVYHKNRKKWRNFMFWSAGCSLLRVDGFSCSLDVLYGGLGIIKLLCFIKKYKFSFSCTFFTVFGHKNPGSGWIRIRIDLKCWIRIRIRIRIETNADPKHCSHICKLFVR